MSHKFHWNVIHVRGCVCTVSLAHIRFVFQCASVSVCPSHSLRTVLRWTLLYTYSHWIHRIRISSQWQPVRWAFYLIHVGRRANQRQDGQDWCARCDFSDSIDVVSWICARISWQCAGCTRFNGTISAPFILMIQDSRLWAGSVSCPLLLPLTTGDWDACGSTDTDRYPFDDNVQYTCARGVRICGFYSMLDKRCQRKREKKTQMRLKIERKKKKKKKHSRFWMPHTAWKPAVTISAMSAPSTR